MDTVAAKLREARALVAKGWTQGQYARSATNRPASPLRKAAVCYCALGAIQRATGHEGDYGPEFNALEKVVVTDDYIGVPDWNDAPERTQADVLAAFDRAIELAEAGQ